MQKDLNGVCTVSEQTDNSIKKTPSHKSATGH